MGGNEQVDGTSRMSTEGTTGVWGGSEVGTINEGRGNVVEYGHDVSGVTAPQLAKIFVECAIAALMGSAFDAPMVTDSVQQEGGRGLGQGQTRDAVGDKDRLFAGLFTRSLAHDFEDLSQMWPV